MKQARFWIFLAVFIFAVFLPLEGLHGERDAGGGGEVTLISIATDGTQGNNLSGLAFPSNNGEFVTFVSLASNLVPNDTNLTYDVFARDVISGTTMRVSVASDGTQGNGPSFPGSISADGRYVAFQSDANNLVPGDTNNVTDLFLRDLLDEVTFSFTVEVSPTIANGASVQPRLTADGRYVVFTSQASNLVPNDTNNASDVFWVDLQGVFSIRRLSVAADGTQGNFPSQRAYISPNGEYVTFDSAASNLVPDDTNNTADVFRVTLDTGEIVRVSVATDGTQGNAPSTHGVPANNGDVVFTSLAGTLVPGDTNNAEDVYLYDGAGSVTRISVPSTGGQGNGNSANGAVSPDGRYAAFHSVASNLVPGDTNNTADVFHVDLDSLDVSLLSTAADGAQGNGPSFFPIFSHNGLVVTFESYATNLVTGDLNNFQDAFYRRYIEEQDIRRGFLPLIRSGALAPTPTATSVPEAP